MWDYAMKLQYQFCKNYYYSVCVYANFNSKKKIIILTRLKQWKIQSININVNWQIELLKYGMIKTNLTEILNKANSNEYDAI